ncbi:MAG: hypothetical protein HQ592_03400 [Planctomycetes bacterium]|nr:hypothetical protein [Planctomycetota bacterium]
MRFARIGRTYQPCIETSDDLQEILSLDESLWVATSAPLTAFHCDAEFMSLFDVDRNGRIYSDELKAAIGWLLERLADTSHLAEHSDSLPISAIQSDTPDGQTLMESARYVLDDLARAGEDTITLGEVREFVAGVQSKPFNGDGVIVPDAASDADLKSFIEDTVACLGGAVDASGRKGIREEHLDAFMSAARAYLEWK